MMEIIQVFLKQIKALILHLFYVDKTTLDLYRPNLINLQV